MLVKTALTKICPQPTQNITCAADMCMCWQWEPGHDREYDETVVWYGDNLYPLPSLPITGEEEDREVVNMLRNCHEQIRANVVRSWTPPAPKGDGWTLHEKGWEAYNVKPYAVFRRHRSERHGYCGLARARVVPDELDRSA